MLLNIFGMKLKTEPKNPRGSVFVDRDASPIAPSLPHPCLTPELKLFSAADGLGAASHSQLREDLVVIALNRAKGQMQPGGYLLVEMG